MESLVANWFSKAFQNTGFRFLFLLHVLKVSRIETNKKRMTEWMNGDKNKTSVISCIVVFSVFLMLLNVGNLHLESIMIKGLSYLLLYLFFWNSLISKTDIIIKNACARLDWIMIRNMKWKGNRRLKE